MASSRATLKAFFETGDIPTEAEFAEQIDSLASLIDTNFFEAENTHDADIILKNTRVQRAENGGGQIDFRAFDTDDVVFSSSDNGEALKGWCDIQDTGINIGFGDFLNPANLGGDLFCDASRATLAFQGIRMVDVGLNKLGFFTATAVTKPIVTGSRAGNAALASLLTALATLGLITDSTTA